jgi:poly-gamma-glutamate capsule biosynthesis protein CapA/YwtB (metallophosphatase superfamily)
MLLAVVLFMVGGGVAAACQVATPPYAGAGEARLIFVGDIMLGRYVGRYLVQSGNHDAPFAAIKSYISSADLAIANLESPLVPRGTIPIPAPAPNELNLTGDARGTYALSRAGFDLLSVANNHALDAGTRGLNYTVTYVRRAGMAPFGMDPGEANGGQKPVIRTLRGLRIAFLGYTDIMNIPGTSGVGFVRPGVQADLDRMAREVRAARQSADLVVVMMHAGAEYVIQPGSSQKAIARTAAGAGADLVVGAHPHVAQGMETLSNEGRTTLVAYSLGNALFDQESRPELRQGLALEATVDRSGVRLARLVPLQILSSSRGYTTNLCDDPSCTVALDRAAQSAAADVKWQALWSGQASGKTLAYRRAESADRSSIEELGLGAPTRVELRGGVLSVAGLDRQSQWHTVWQTEDDWRVTGYTVGDANVDGTLDLVYTVWKRRLTSERPEDGGLDVDPEGGPVLPHIYINSWRDGEMKPLWHGSPRPAPLLGVAVAPVGKDGKLLLATLESNNAGIERAPGKLTLWEWTGGFGFELAATVPGSYSNVWSDGRLLLFR